MKEHKQLLPFWSVLEIGFGLGIDATELLNLGYKYTGIDPSKSFLKIAKDRNPNTTFLPLYAHELNKSLGLFDGFWATAVLIHIPKNNIVETLLNISSVLKKEAIGFITMKEGNGEMIEESTKRYYSFYSKKDFSDILNKSGFEIIKFDNRKSSKNNWLVFFVRKIND